MSFHENYEPIEGNDGKGNTKKSPEKKTTIEKKSTLQQNNEKVKEKSLEDLRVATRKELKSLKNQVEVSRWTAKDIFSHMQAVEKKQVGTIVTPMGPSQSEVRLVSVDGKKITVTNSWSGEEYDVSLKDAGHNITLRVEQIEGKNYTIRATDNGKIVSQNAALAYARKYISML